MHELLPMAAGDYMDVSDETFRLFETQMYQPAADVYEIVNISSQEQPNPQGAAPVKSVKGKAAFCSMPAVKKLGNSADIESISVSTDMDDFVTLIRPKRIYFPEHFCYCFSSNLCVLNTTNTD
jgi:hypothetical protein